MKIKRSGIINTLPGGIVLGVLSGLAAQLILSFMTAAMIENEIISIDRIGILAAVLRWIAVFLGATVGTILVKNAPFTVPAGVLIGTVLLWILISVVILDGRVHNLLPSLIMPVLACLCAILWIITKERRGKGSYKKKHYR